MSGGSAFQTINRFVVHQDREKMDPSRGTVRSKGSLRKDCMGLAAKKVLCRVVFGGNAEIVERTTGEPLHNHVAEDWFNEWQAGKAETKSAATAERDRQVTR